MQIKRRVTDFESFDIYTAEEAEKTEHLFTHCLGPGLIMSVKFRVLPKNLSQQVMLNGLLIGNRNHITGPGILSPLIRPSNNGLHVSTGEEVKLAFTHPPQPCRIVGYIEIIHVTDL